MWGTLFVLLYIYWGQTVWAHSLSPVVIQGGKSVADTLYFPVYIQETENNVTVLSCTKSMIRQEIQ